ncbi:MULTISPECIES: phosphatidate cytidylyltransferase [Rhizobium]|jgi:phosphatidate cytidylyltransferase|uniref:Phosphatidate cytidylyltransferase n=1 Tax=Rhizobium lusitanum TaxID=293958 RepID=A0A1C3VG36_9HYPH|nr:MULTISPECIES: phosphatidate cytidylyltransferase [Rhizobium]NKJ05537.1 phosphatidate cytidylyltransferase [Rhizobium sp. SG741]NKJ34624.1 phosphatidate cytidylyltransferase [Rhizobium sp. SG570]SCB26587.1 phosphatidate cytidylyltransferase [Rhizobium lusitanum]
MSRELRLRVISGIVLAVIVLAATWYGGLSFRLLAAAIGLLVYYEWSTIADLHGRDPQGNALGWLGLVLIAGATLMSESVYSIEVLVAFVAATTIMVAVRRTTWWLPGGIFYSGLTAIALAEIRDDDLRGFVLMLFVFATVWATDIFAYFVGRAIGGPKLAPRISPGKTWSGAIGGAVAAIIAGTAVVWSFFSADDLRIPVLALVLSVCSQIGDLFESFIKRRFGVKDSSHLIPGHGGVMDRVDGLIFACFAAFLLAIVISLTMSGETLSLGGVLLGV